MRSYFAAYLRKHGISAEYIDLLQGRIPKPVFARHYLKAEDAKEIVDKVLVETDNLKYIISVVSFLAFQMFRRQRHLSSFFKFHFLFSKHLSVLFQPFSFGFFVFRHFYSLLDSR